ncbi:MAG: hypothetical protein P8X63_07020 [Desulfuromonadaceae bacterium]
MLQRGKIHDAKLLQDAKHPLSAAAGKGVITSRNIVLNAFFGQPFLHRRKSFFVPLTVPPISPQTGLLQQKGFMVKNSEKRLLNLGDPLINPEVFYL